MHSVVLLKTGRTFVKVRVAAGNTIEEVVDGLQLMMSQIPVRLVRAERVVINASLSVIVTGVDPITIRRSLDTELVTAAL